MNWRNWNEKKKKLEAEETVDWPSTIPEDEGGKKKIFTLATGMVYIIISPSQYSE